MPKRKSKGTKEKPAVELTKDEAMERVFGEEIAEAAKQVAHQKDPIDVRRSPADALAQHGLHSLVGIRRRR